MCAWVRRPARARVCFCVCVCVCVCVCKRVQTCLKPLVHPAEHSVLNDTMGVFTEYLFPSLCVCVCVCRLGGEEGDRVRGGPLGLGLIVGGAVFTHGWQRGCKKAEILAINDDGTFVAHHSYACFMS